jgi:dihydropteroate synthase
MVARMLTIEHLAALLHAHRNEASVQVKEFELAGQEFRFNSDRFFMGVVNLSGGSWYRESVCLGADAAVRRGRILHAQGAHIVDVGAESTLAHAARVGEAQQRSALLPVLKALREEGILVSVETYEPSVAKACLEAGANVLNLTGSGPNEEIYRMVAANGAAVIICYVQGPNVREVGDFNLTADPVALMLDYFREQIDTAKRNGVDKIFIDPGLGFYYRNLQDSAVRVRHQMQVFLNSFRLRQLGYPICHALPHAFEFFEEEVRCAEPFFAVLAALGKTDLFRTHEVPRTRAVLRTMNCF